MIQIHKNNPPKKFQQFKQQNPNSHFDDMPSEVKAELRHSLLEEQGYLCAYCMRRIHDGNTKIEHYEPRNAQNEMDYSNLLAVCDGTSRGNLPQHQHCDTKKANKHLRINPQNADHMKCISYRTDGTIYAKDNEDFNNDLSSTLNLNDEYGYLKSNRKSALDKLKKRFCQECGDKSASHKFIEKSLEFYLDNDENNQRQEYCGILIDYLMKRLRQL